MPESQRLAFAVCPRPEETGDPRAPKLFTTEAEAREFLNAEVAILALDAPRDAETRDRIRNKHQAWQGPVPVRRMADYVGPRCGQTLRQFLP
jgi:hypothetical protein